MGHFHRVCPGRAFAEASVFAAVAAVLHSFTVSPPLDSRGESVRLDKTVKMTPGVISYVNLSSWTVLPFLSEAFIAYYIGIRNLMSALSRLAPQLPKISFVRVVEKTVETVGGGPRAGPARLSRASRFIMKLA